MQRKSRPWFFKHLYKCLIMQEWVNRSAEATDAKQSPCPASSWAEIQQPPIPNSPRHWGWRTLTLSMSNLREWLLLSELLMTNKTQTQANNTDAFVKGLKNQQMRPPLFFASPTEGESILRYRQLLATPGDRHRSPGDSSLLSSGIHLWSRPHQLNFTYFSSFPTAKWRTS